MKILFTPAEPAGGRRAAPWPLLLLVLVPVGCAPGGHDDEAGGAEEDTTTVRTDTAPAPEPGDDAYIRPSMEAGDLVAGDTIAGEPSWTEQDYRVLERAVRQAWERGWDRLPVGERMARIGETFVGTPYVPQTLDPPGPERLVINLRALDCVTYVENMLALAHFAREAPLDVFDRPTRARSLYAGLLTRIRYRQGKIEGYPSRLHYFTEWIRDNEAKGLVRDVTRDLGGVPDDEPIHFMSSHRDAYRQLTGLDDFRRIREIEERLSAEPRYYVPQERVADARDGIRTGDIIAITSTLDGLDVAHTGIAVWQGSELHFMNAPLVGKDVQISEKTLANRILGISKQDGIMVARPLDGTAR